MEKVFILAFYDKDDKHTNVVLSAVNKLNYLIDVLSEAGLAIHIISPSLSAEKKRIKGRNEVLKWVTQKNGKEK